MDASKLEPGKTYFICGYHHQKYPIPYIKTYIFVRKEPADKTDPSGKTVYVFQHPQRYYKDAETDVKVDIGGYFEDAEDFPEITINEDDLHILQDFSGLLEWLTSLKKSAWADNVF